MYAICSHEISNVFAQFMQISLVKVTCSDDYHFTCCGENVLILNVCPITCLILQNCVANTFVTGELHFPKYQYYCSLPNYLLSLLNSFLTTSCRQSYMVTVYFRMDPFYDKMVQSIIPGHILWSKHGRRALTDYWPPAFR